MKLEELSKYFHLPEKSVAKELGICLTSLKKLCRSYGITRWPFRKLKSLERTMKKVQTEEEAISSQATGSGEGGGSDVRRKPYTVGNKTVFLSDEELEVFKMTMGKQATHELKPASLETLELSLFNQVCTFLGFRGIMVQALEPLLCNQVCTFLEFRGIMVQALEPLLLNQVCTFNLHTLDPTKCNMDSALDTTMTLRPYKVQHGFFLRR